MHVQRAIEHSDGPKTIVCTDVSDARLDDLCVTFGDEARSKAAVFLKAYPDGPYSRRVHSAAAGTDP